MVRWIGFTCGMVGITNLRHCCSDDALLVPLAHQQIQHPTVAMPPKKVEEPERKPLIGRVGTNLRVGIVGVPNVGKSTFFNVLTKSSAPAENFPFCTIDPNENKYPTDFLVYLNDSIKWFCAKIIHYHVALKLLLPDRSNRTRFFFAITQGPRAGPALRLPGGVPQAGQVSDPLARNYCNHILHCHYV